MKRPLLLGAAALALLASPLALQSNADAQTNTRSQAMTVDPVRGVLTMAPLLERVTPAVVSIQTLQEAPENTTSSPEQELMERFFGGRMSPNNRGPRGGLGSGVIYDASKGLIITNNHVIKDADEIMVTLNDRREVEAELVGADPKTDLALLKIDARDLTELRLANTGEARVGDYVIAVGNPFGLSSTVTSGIISALGRDQRSGDNYSNYIQTDASINPGNSGGALVNSKGELIGINTAIVSRSGGNNGIGFAVPVRTVKNVIEQLRENGEVKRGRIGVQIQNVTPALREGLGLKSMDGALVSDVGAGTPAEKAGLEEGDIVIAFNGEEILDSNDLRNLVGLLKPGTRADVTFLRDGKRRTTRIGIAEMPDDEDETSSPDSRYGDAEPATLEAFDGAEVSNIPDDLELRGGDDGVYIMSVERGSRAARAGLQKGDVIRRIGRTDISDLDDFEDAIKGEEGPYALRIERQGRNLYLAVK
ncbi:serine endoprotease DegQ [Litorimonas cladophorae]|uniref:Serine endoprotease DegQ n=1 Tax=Litorimonas cladophorae TaxID=1220491 RepID=A0A918NJD2_9PROT|nr:DegQ family serine endoprotease [Litorimonas cladophorae]GGX72097.1 serine endoprotease DegQ [Litorimonas cladophorae]